MPLSSPLKRINGEKTTILLFLDLFDSDFHFLQGMNSMTPTYTKCQSTQSQKLLVTATAQFSVQLLVALHICCFTGTFCVV